MEKQEKTIYTMELHETFRKFRDSDDLVIRRVPDGWIYIYYVGRDICSSVFVPWSAEFKERSKQT